MKVVVLQVEVVVQVVPVHVVLEMMRIDLIYWSCLPRMLGRSKN